MYGGFYYGQTYYAGMSEAAGEVALMDAIDTGQVGGTDHGHVGDSVAGLIEEEVEPVWP
jgi:hypothetical protein